MLVVDNVGGPAFLSGSAEALPAGHPLPCRAQQGSQRPGLEDFAAPEAGARQTMGWMTSANCAHIVSPVTPSGFFSPLLTLLAPPFHVLDPSRAPFAAYRLCPILSRFRSHAFASVQ
jgi:hypothetical protein